MPSWHRENERCHTCLMHTGRCGMRTLEWTDLFPAPADSVTLRLQPRSKLFGLLPAGGRGTILNGLSYCLCSPSPRHAKGMHLEQQP
jgi:hypothetical protein